jgi:hypothetical protein
MMQADAPERDIPRHGRRTLSRHPPLDQPVLTACLVSFIRLF